MMKHLVVLIVMLNFMACIANGPAEAPPPQPAAAVNSAEKIKTDTPDPAKPMKSPHGYIIQKDYELGRFGGFVGDCTNEQNWPYYWQCMSENSGNGGFK